MFQKTEQISEESDEIDVAPVKPHLRRRRSTSIKLKGQDQVQASEILPGYTDYNRLIMRVHDFYRILYISAYFYLVPFTIVIITCAQILV